MQLGNYTVSKNSEEFKIYPKNKQNETIPLTVSRRFFTLQHASGDTVTFKNYLWRGQWLWNDSRRKGPCDKQHAIIEVARMLFNGDTNKAIDWLQ